MVVVRPPPDDPPIGMRPIPMEIGGPPPPPPIGRGDGPLPISSSLMNRLPRFAGFSSLERLACFSFFLPLVRFSCAGAGCVQLQVGPTARLASDRLRARSIRRCAVTARSLFA